MKIRFFLDILSYKWYYIRKHSCISEAGVKKLEIRYSKQAAKFLKKQTKETQTRIINAVNNIPYGDIKKLTGTNFYRLRIGDYRVIFDNLGNIIEVLKINNRGEIYKGGF